MEEGAHETKEMQMALDELAKEYSQQYPDAEFKRDFNATLNVLKEVARPEDIDLLESTRLGNHPMMIKELMATLKPMEAEYFQAMESGAMRDVQLDALRLRAQDAITRAIAEVKNRYISHYGPLSY